jgi:hypothetical protein
MESLGLEISENSPFLLPWRKYRRCDLGEKYEKRKKREERKKEERKW